MQFYTFGLRPGDLLYNKKLAAVLTRKTRAYWYYRIGSHEGRIGIGRLWNLIDTGKIKISYGSSMKYRRKNTKERTLDLHGVKHEEVPEVLARFLNFVKLPCKIITGDSQKMIELVKKTVKNYDWVCYHDTVNRGLLHVYEKN